MQLFVGTSGYSYKEWKGSFYPEKLPPKEMLNFYAQHFATVEINNTFYKMPDADVLESWTQQVPKKFQFVVKAPQLITHRKRLKNSHAELDQLFAAVDVLKGNRGPLFFQLPPNLKRDIALLDDFLGLIARRAKTAVEFRHPSWFDDDVFECLRKHSAALCAADAEDLPEARLVKTADWGYVRLRRESYTDKQLKDWVKQIKSLSWESVFVFFKHEDTGTGPQFAARFLELAAK